MTPTRSASEGVHRYLYRSMVSLPRLRFGLVCVAAFALALRSAADESAFQVENHDDRYVITHGGKPVATYIFRDEKILRPYFAHVHAPDGTQVTRHHPPRSGIDAVDHDTMHPGIWLAFGDLGGADFWRNKGRTEHMKEQPLHRPPAVMDGVVSFQVVNLYMEGDRTVCTELARHTVEVLADGYLLTCASKFTGGKRPPYAFGDQEEMGLGVRLATPLVVKGGSGSINNSSGGKNEQEVWGQQADWCDYSGVVERDGVKRRAGMLLIPHKDNFRRSWFHVRDYGLLVANPFGRNAFTKGDKSRIEIKPGDKLDLRFGIWIYSTPSDKPPDLDSIAKEYHRLAKRP